MQFNIIFKTIFEYIHDKFCFVHTCTNTFCKYRKKLLASPRVHLVFLVVFSFFEKTTYCCRARRLSVRPSVCLSVRLSVRPSVCPSVEIISFRGNSLSNRPIKLKIGLNVREGVVHVR